MLLKAFESDQVVDEKVVPTFVEHFFFKKL
jgi:hypothetical protein